MYQEGDELWVSVHNGFVDRIPSEPKLYVIMEANKSTAYAAPQGRKDIIRKQAMVQINQKTGRPKPGLFAGDYYVLWESLDHYREAIEEAEKREELLTEAKRRLPALSNDELRDIIEKGSDD